MNLSCSVVNSNILIIKTFKFLLKADIDGGGFQILGLLHLKKFVFAH